MRKIYETLFGDGKDTEEFSAKRMGISMAATWSWGAAIAVGIAIMQSKGFLPFAVWTIGNILSIPFFGFLYSKVDGVSNWKKFTPFVLLWGFIGIFAIIMNLNALKAALGGGTDIVSFTFIPEPYLTSFVMLVGLSITYFIHKTRLKGSVLTDVGQFTLQFVGVVGMVLAGLLTGARADISWITQAGQGWMLTAFLGIITGATASGMQWQRIENTSDEKKFMSTVYGGLYFGVFMLFVTAAGFLFNGSLVMSIPFLVCVIAVATSTTDSGTASLQFVSDLLPGKMNVGSLIALVATLSYPIVSDWGLTSIWGLYAGVRWKIVAFMLAMTLIYNVFKSEKVKQIAEKLGVWLR